MLVKLLTNQLSVLNFQNNYYSRDHVYKNQQTYTMNIKIGILFNGNFIILFAIRVEK